MTESHDYSIISILHTFLLTIDIMNVIKFCKGKGTFLDLIQKANEENAYFVLLI